MKNRLLRRPETPFVPRIFLDASPPAYRFRLFLRKGDAVPIRCCAEQADQGVLLSGIAAMADAESIRAYFAGLGVPAMLAPPSRPGHYHVFLARLSLQILRKLIKVTDIELIP